MNMTPTIHSPDQNDVPKDEEFPSNEFPPINNVDSETSSDEEDMIDGNGYQLLPQCAGNEEEQGAGDEFSSDREEEEEEEVHENPFVHNLFLQNLNVPSNTEASAAVERLDSSPMDQDKIEEIKSAMAGFTLPHSSIPDWALHISEEDWKTELTTRLQRKIELQSESSVEK